MAKFVTEEGGGRASGVCRLVFQSQAVLDPVKGNLNAWIQKYMDSLALRSCSLGASDREPRPWHLLAGCHLQASACGSTATSRLSAASVVCRCGAMRTVDPLSARVSKKWPVMESLTSFHAWFITCVIFGVTSFCFLFFFFLFARPEGDHPFGFFSPSWRATRVGVLCQTLQLILRRQQKSGTKADAFFLGGLDPSSP